MKALETLEITSPEDSSKEIQKRAIHALEEGQVVFLPKLSFKLQPSEERFFSPTILSPKSKNISFELKHDRLGGTVCENEDRAALKEMMKRYAVESKKLIDTLFPHYIPFIKQGRTSFRPAEVAGRISSYRKDDTRLHIDAFPATPVKGNRILRVFCNVNPHGAPRVWNVGEPFPVVVEKMAPRVRPPLPGSSLLLKLLKITKDYRTKYDHYMLNMHDIMKGDTEYQKNAEHTEIKFPPYSSWIVYSDQVSHAALSGQYLFEQTFYLPPEGVSRQETSPLRVLEKFLNKKLL
ncbi:MAG: hypothetical protein HKM07_03380 [Chlamydiae bacterium]|nr:hypothetical protein [Chlamydiota bacterium]